MQPIDKKRDFVFIFLALWVYTALCSGRYNYSASMVSIISKFGFGYSNAGSVFSMFEIPYGIGQFIVATIVYRCNQRLLIFFSLVLSAIANVAITMVSTVEAMRLCWFFNGCVQSFAWCSLIKSLAENVSNKSLPNAIIIAGATYPLGNFFAYLTAALGAKLGMWSLSFYCSAMVMLIGAVLWMVLYKKEYYLCKINAEASSNSEIEKPSSHSNRKIWVFVILMCVSSVMVYFIKDGVSSYLPSMIKESFNLSEALSITSTIALPFVGVFSSFWAKELYRRWGNHSMQNFAAMVISGLCAVGVVWALGRPALAQAIFFAVVIFFSMALVTNVITSMAPLNFRNRFDSGRFAGLTSGCGHFGGALGAIVLGHIAEKAGWAGVYWCIAIVALIAAVISVVSYCVERR